MPAVSKKRPARLKIVLYLIIILTLGAILAIFISYRLLSKHPEALLPVVEKAANLSIGRVHQTSTKNGIPQWTLDAKSARYFEDKKETVLEAPEVIFYTKDNKKVYLNADQGILDMNTNDIQAKGNVTVKNDDYMMKTQSLHYNNNMRIIFTNVPVKISGESLILTADSMSVNLDTGKTSFTGKVEGIFSGNFTF
jgi:LPS export ABC transporter protein LptC